MIREKIYKDIEETLGLVPTFIKSIPDEYLAEEWSLFKRLELDETHIPNKYKELMGVALSAATRCNYCTLFHVEAARLHGATDEEIEEAAHFAKFSTGWSTYVHGMQVDYEQFRDEVHRIAEYVRRQREKCAA
ncbi:MAG: carboxymuconolactone decarboxylase family protein [Armatimonadota bacterium]